MTEIPLMGFDIGPKQVNHPSPRKPQGKKPKKKRKKKRPQNGRPQSSRPQNGRPQSSRPKSGRPQSGRPQSGRPQKQVVQTGRNASRKSSAKRQQRRHKKNYTLHYTMLTIFLLTSLAILSFTVFFDIKTIEVTGDSPFEHDKIIEQAGITEGENLLLINKKDISEKIMEQTYLLDSVNVNRKFPSKVEIELEMSDADFCVKYGGLYYYFNKTMRFIDLTKENENPDVIVFRGLELPRLQFGDYLTPTDDNLLEMCLNIQQDIRDSEFEGITYVDMSDDVNISIYYKEQIEIKVGTVTDLPYKLESARYVVTEEITDGQVGVLDVTSEKATYFRRMPIKIP